MSSNELFYRDAQGRKQDAELHDELLDADVEERMYERDRKSLLESGLTEDAVRLLMNERPKAKRKAKAPPTAEAD